MKDVGMKRRFNNWLVIILLLLSVALTALEIRSFLVGDQWVCFSGGQPSIFVLSNYGCLEFMRASNSPDSFKHQDRQIYSEFFGSFWSTRSQKKGASHFQVYWGNDMGESAPYNVYGAYIDPLGKTPIPYFGFIVPIWFLILITMGFLGLCLYFRSRDSRKIKPGICIKCGYDLRATPERCPECGTAVSKKILPPHGLTLPTDLVN